MTLRSNRGNPPFVGTSGGGGGGGGVGIPGTGINSEVHNSGIAANASGSNAFSSNAGVASGDYSHAEGSGYATAQYAHAEGLGHANADNSHAEGTSNTGATAYDAHAEGTGNNANTIASHVEGAGNVVQGTGYAGHAEGNSNIVDGFAAHAEGNDNSALNFAAHAEGQSGIASGAASHSQNDRCQALGNYSHAGGVFNIAHYGQTVIGSFAINDTGLSETVLTAGQRIFKVGGGTSDASRSDLFYVDADGIVASRNGGDFITRQNGQLIFHGNKIWEWNQQKAADDYSTLDFVASVETTIFDQTTAGRNGLVPKLAANYMRSGFGGFWVEARLGLNCDTTTRTFTFRLYAGAVVIASKTIDFAKATNFVAATNLCASLRMWVDPISYINPGTNLRTRSHNRFEVSLRGAVGDYGSYANDNETYANIDATVEQNLKLTGQWSAAGNHMFIDGITIHV